MLALALEVNLVRVPLVADMSRDLEGPTKAEAAVAKMSWWNVCEAYVSVCVCARVCVCVCVCVCVRAFVFVCERA